MDNKYCNYIDNDGKNKKKKIYIIDNKSYIKIGKDKYILKSTFIKKVKKGGAFSLSKTKAINEEEIINNLKTIYYYDNLDERNKSILIYTIIKILRKAIKSFDDIYEIYLSKGSNYQQKILKTLKDEYDTPLKFMGTREKQENDKYIFYLNYDELSRLHRIRTSISRRYYGSEFPEFMVSMTKERKINKLLLNYILQYQGEIKEILKRSFDFDIEIEEFKHHAYYDNDDILFILYQYIIEHKNNLRELLKNPNITKLNDRELLILMLFIYANKILYGMINTNELKDPSNMFSFLIPDIYFEFHKKRFIYNKALYNHKGKLTKISESRE